ncbi:MAG: LacI family DNA-binding transcriptional regulator [Syntrophothermus sp.]
MPTIGDVAREAKVSKATVSRVLNGIQVRHETHRRVLEAIEKLKYRPNAQARGLPLGRTYVIGMIVPEINRDFYSAIVAGVMEILDPLNYSMILYETGNRKGKEVEYANLLRERRVDGLIVVTPREVDGRFVTDLVVNDHFPVVLVDGFVKNAPVSSVMVDNFRGAKAVTQHFLELGHRRIGFIMGLSETRESHDRFEGYRRALEKFHVEFNPAYVWHGDYSRESGKAAAGQILALPQSKRPTAIFVANDSMAVGVVEALEEADIKIPSQMALAGYDDVELAITVRPRLTTVRQPLRDMGRFGARKLINLINGEEPEATRIVLPLELVVRESSGGTAGTYHIA